MAPAQSTVAPQSEPSQLDSRWWTPGTGNNAGLWTCSTCRDGCWLRLHYARRHQASTTHRQTVLFRLQTPDPDLPPAPSASNLPHVIGPLYQLLHDVTEAASIDMAHYSPDHEDRMVLDWEAISTQISGDLGPTTVQTAVAGLTTSLYDWLAADPDNEVRKQNDETRREESPGAHDYKSTGSSSRTSLNLAAPG